ncbi:MAG: trigger factor [Lachnospiraceae bacterium]|nr:trigger factor [Lachnospiraceae bacterium]
MKRKNFILAITCACALAVSAVPAGVLAEEETEALDAAEETESVDDEEADTDSEEDADETEDETGDEADAVRPTYTALDYVVLGEYKGLTIELEPVEVTDEDVLAEAEELVSYSDAVEMVTEGTVEEGDTVDITYVGTMDGEEFDGGSGDYELEIGSGDFIEGFEEGLIGVEAGETVDLNLTFPEDYYYDELAGQEVVFTVTVNGIMSVPELSDEVAEIASDGEYTDLDSWLEYIREYLTEDAESEWTYNVQDALLTELAANSEITGYPQDLIDYSVNDAISYYELIASYYEMEYEDLIEAYFGSEETFLEYLNAAIEESLDQEMLLMAVAETEGLELTDEEYQAGLEAYAEEYGYESGEEMEADYGETEMSRYILLDKVYQFLEENSEIVEITEDETETETDTEDGEEVDWEDDTDAETDEAADETETAETEAEETEAAADAETETTETETDAD